MSTNDSLVELEHIEQKDNTGEQVVSKQDAIAVLSRPAVDADIFEGKIGHGAWCVLAGGWLLLFTTFGYTNAFGVYQDLLTVAKTSSASNISWIGSTQLFFFNAMALPAGRLLDKGYFLHTMVVGSLLYSFSLFMVSLSHVDKYYQLYLSLGIGMGLGSGLLYIPAVAIQAHYWKKRRAFAMGLVITGSSTGGIVYPILLNQLLFYKGKSFGDSVRASAYLSLGLLAIANCLMFIALFKRSEPARNAKSGTAAVKDVLKDKTYMVTLAGLLLIFWGLFFPYFYLQLYVISRGIDSTFAFYTLAIINAASVFGRTIPNYLADRFGPLNVLTLVSLASGVLILGMLGISTIGATVVFAILYGFFSGAVLSVVSPTLASFASDHSQVGVRLGIAFSIGSICNLTGTPIDGALLTSTYVWHRPIVFSATVIIAGSVFVAAGRTMLASKRRKVWV